MKRILSILFILLLLCATVFSFTACNDKNDKGEDQNQHQHVDYVANTKLDMNSSTKKLEVQVKSHIDGDTTHFYVPASVDPTGIMKARYLAVNTPESTGRIEEWGKAASKFTEEKILNAVSVVVESEDSNWNFDGNGRYLVWVWYKPSADSEYRNLNLELLQSGLAVGSKALNTRYGEQAVAAIAQATTEKLYVFSDEIDPSYPYGAAKSVTLRELRTNIEEYDGDKVAFEGVITMYSENTAYIEEYDAETGISYGIQLFDGYSPTVRKILEPGYRVRIVGTVGLHWGTWQISSLSHNPMKPNDPANSTVISKNNQIPSTETSAETFTGDVTYIDGDESKTANYEKMVLSTSITMKNLVVKSVYTTTSSSASDKGAMTLTCMVDGIEISVRTSVFKDENGNVLTKKYFEGATIDVRGIVEYFDYDLTDDIPGSYQIKVYSLSHVTKH